MQVRNGKLDKQKESSESSQKEAISNINRWIITIILITIVANPGLNDFENLNKVHLIFYHELKTHVFPYLTK